MKEGDLQEPLNNFVFYENLIRAHFNDKLCRIKYCKNLNKQIDYASTLWKNDSNVISNLDRLKQISFNINKNFLEYKLIDILKLFYFFIGFHEEYFYKLDKSHPIIDLIEKPFGYCYKNTSGYIMNRLEEAMRGKNVGKNNMRIEMCLAYLFIFNSRLMFGNNLGKEIGKNKYNNLLDLTLIELINNTKLSLKRLTYEKNKFSRVLNGFRGDLLSNNLTKKQYNQLVSLSLRNLINILVAGHHLKKKIYNEGWMMLRPSFFEIDADGWTTKTYMCRIYEGPETNLDFPFKSMRPKIV